MKALQIIIAMMICFNVKGQEVTSNNHLDHISCIHNISSHPTTELGVAILASRLDDGNIVAGIHGHLIRSINDRVGLGIGYEQLYGEHQHRTISGVISYRVSHEIVLSVAPGLTLEREAEAPTVLEKKPSVHVEAIYELEVLGIHTGPLLELAYDQDEYHISLGIHIGIGW